MTQSNSTNGNDALCQEDDARLLERLQAWMAVRLSEELNVAPAEIDVCEPLLNYGLNSIVAFALTGELADLVGRELPATLFWDFPTIQALAFHLVDELKDEKTAESVAAEIGHFLSRVEELPENETLSHEKQRK